MRVYSQFLLDVARVGGEALVLVPLTECVVSGPVVRGGSVKVDRVEWRKGPHGHRIVGTCSTGCHIVVEYPKAWRQRGHAIADAIGEPSRELEVEPLEEPARPHHRGRK